ncbi:MAG: DUF4091 domain-containing protein [Hyellaceae cyanobacterium CSU_1_1]|nr:DUF4091 domain-containing protein [Hyellaceae cyanobacterium CSU_1_1]
MDRKSLARSADLCAGRYRLSWHRDVFYPGDKVGLNQVVPSIRLKRLREGMEDYEYTEILKKLGYQDWAMKIVREVGANWKDWTKDTNILDCARQKLGEKIHQLSSS